MRVILTVLIVALGALTMAHQMADAGDRTAESGASGKKRAAETGKKTKIPTLATLTVNNKRHEMKHAIAFQGYWFDERVPMVLFCEKPIPTAKLKNALKKGFDGQEMMMLSLGPFLSFRFTSPDKPVVSGWADNLSLGSNSNLKVEAKIKDGRVRGKVAMPKAGKLGPFTYQFQASFDLEITEIKP